MALMPKDAAGPSKVLEALSRRFDELTGSQKRIVEFVVRNPEEIAFMTLDRLAAAIEVSPSTVVRLCYKLGYDGYTDMQEKLQTLLLSRLNPEAGAPVSAGVEAEQQLMDQAFELDIHNLRETRRLLQSQDIDRAVQMICGARQIRVMGLRSTYGAAHSLALGLDKVLGNVGILDSIDGHLPEQVQNLGPEDLFIGITFPRYSSHTVDVAHYLRERRCPVLAITDSPISPLARSADLVLPCAHKSLTVQNSLTACFSLIHGIIALVCTARQEVYQERLAQTEALIDRWNTIMLRQRSAPDES